MSSKLQSNLTKESQANSKQVEPREASGKNGALEKEIRPSSAANNRAVS